MKAIFYYCIMSVLQNIVTVQCFRKFALIIVDVQNDFCAGGSLAVPNADNVIPIINSLRSAVTFRKVIFTMDWHPPGHISFYDRFSVTAKFPGAKLYEDYTFDLGDERGRRTQRLWPVHCVQNTSGAALRDGLKVFPEDDIVFKGTHVNVDSYSGFLDNDGIGETRLDKLLKEADIHEIVVAGLAFEFCVGNTALDGVKKGYKVSVLEDATGFFENDQTDIMRKKFAMAGVKVISAKSLLNSGATSGSVRILISVATIFPLMFYSFSRN